MSQPGSSLSFDQAQQSLSQLAGALEAFVEAWDREGAPPDISAFLPSCPDVRLEILVELIKIDLEYRWQVHRLPKRIRDYLAEFPELARIGPPPDLIYEEFHIRRQAGQAVDPADYLREFPDQETELACLLGIDHEYTSTAVYKDAGKDQLKRIEPGQRLDDFELLVRLGAGSFAQVYLARQVSMQRLVAVKISADHGTEPQTLAQLDHDHIVRVYDTRTLEERKLRLLYMQYVSGGTLQTVVQELRRTETQRESGSLLLRAVDRALEVRAESRPTDSPLRAQLQALEWPETVCWIGARLASALDYAHNRGVLHRDIKPANVLVSAEGVPKLADFNISFSSKVQGVSPAAYFGGSLAYMSPEQLEASNPGHERQPETLDGRSDLYSLGVMLWELLTGQRPFADSKQPGGWIPTLEAMIERRHKGIGPEALKQVPARTPPGMIRVLRKCLQPNPDDRWQSGAELASQLELCRHPRAQQLLLPEESSFYRRLLPWGAAIVVLLAMLPNIAAGWFNWVYNEAAIVDHLSEASQRAFHRILLIINGIAYPVGAVLVWWRYRSVVRERAGPHDADRLRERLLNLGNFAAIVGVIEWAIAGLAYPGSIRLAAGELPTIAYVHFFASLVICGLVAASYPFFLVTEFCFRVIYPFRLTDVRAVRSDLPLLKRTLRRSILYLVLAALAPMLGVLMALYLTSGTTRIQQQALRVFALVGLIGFGVLLFWLFRRLRNDIEDVVEAAGALK